MWKKVIISCLLILFTVTNLCSASASFTDDITQFEQKYSNIYSSVDPVITSQMESFLQDVVDTIVDNYDDSISLNEQINYVVTVVLTDDPEYSEDLLPFLLGQMENQEQYQNQISEMKAIVRKEVERRISLQTPPTTPPTNPGSSSGGVTQNNSLAADKEIALKLSQGATTIQLAIGNNSEGLTLSESAIQKVISAGKTLVLTGAGISLNISSEPANVPSNGVLSLNINQLPEITTGSMVDNLPVNSKLGPIYEIQGKINNISTVVLFPSPISITVPYNLGEFAGIREELLDVYYYNEGSLKWEKMNGTIDQSKKTITFTTTHFSKYAVMSYTPEPTSKFSDLTGHWAAKEINTMVLKGLVSGISATEFAPERNITRAEFATLLLRVLGISSVTQIAGRFNDVPAKEWYFNAVNTAADKGLVSGYTANTFGPNDPITREQIAVMINRALIYKGSISNIDTSANTDLKNFADESLISPWAFDGVSTAVALGIMKGRSTTQFAPLEKATRAEAAVMILRIAE